MRKLLTFLVALGAIVFAVVSRVSAQGINGGGFNVSLGPFVSGGGGFALSLGGNGDNYSPSGYDRLRHPESLFWNLGIRGVASLTKP
jgi:hypothetical protein